MASTVRDVADRAGVSASTVSRAFTRPEKVDPATRQRILEIAEDLGYRPSGAARSLKTGRSGALGIVVPDLSNPFFSDVVRGTQRQARRYGYSVLLADSDEDPGTELELVRTLAPNVDAIVLCAPRMSDDDLAEAAAVRPVVLVNRRTGPPAALVVPPVTVDNRGGVERAVRHLQALGHRRIGFVAGPTTSRSNAQRRAAFVDATAAPGCEGVVVGSYAPTVEGGAAAADDALLAGVTGVVVYNDIMAAGLLGRLTRLGFALPERLSVVGFDDISLSALLTPALTTVHIPLEQAGAVAVDRLHAHLTGEDLAAGTLEPLPTELVVRASTEAVRTA
ncbi:LacI family DNA-binding transcriptional regulator [Cellulomonas hominis]|uniref:LacI family DNA-binding transcriptional regulator n=1 Tax=Cellulomonas hominis TaxID=156981 RepID=UPI001B8F1301|nr:LacI family DNA-binding transcriptional regulator [Cellulomonas hominis]VTR76537.1 HTH-type transcriptional repressor CytR [Cellulomonas hominis]